MDLAKTASSAVLFVAVFVAVIYVAAAGVAAIVPGAHPIFCLAIPTVLAGLALGGAVYADDNGRF